MNATYQTTKLVLNKRTGEISVDEETNQILEVVHTYTITPFTAPEVNYDQLTTAQKPVQTQWSPEHTKDALRLRGVANDAKIEAQEATPSVVVPLPVKRITRPKKFTANPIARHIILADVQEKLALAGMPQQNWVEDYVMGACYTVAKASNGKLNVNPAHIFAAVKMDLISTGHIMAMCEGISERQAQRIGQCARYALAGMQMYLDRNPSQYATLQSEADLINDALNEYQKPHTKGLILSVSPVLERYTSVDIVSHDI